MDQLTESLGRKISLRHGEDDLVAVDPLQEASRADVSALMLVGRVVIDRELSINALRANIRRLLNPVKGVDIKLVGVNMVTLKFSHPLDRKHALAGCPWAIERHPLLLEPFNLAIRPENHILVNMPIVVRIMQLSLANHSEHVAKLIGNNLGTFIEEPKPPPGLYSPYFKIKIAVDVTRPLKRGIFFQGVEGTKEWIQVVYERLPTFCFLCGILGHGEAKCPMRYEKGFEEPEEELPYGSWMRANLETQGPLGAAGLAVRVTPVEGSVSRGGSVKSRGSEIFAFGAMRGKETRAGYLLQDENANPNTQKSDHPHSKAALTLGSPTNSINSVASSKYKGRKKIVVPSNKRKAKEATILEEQMASKRIQLQLKDVDVFSLTAEAAGQPRRDQ